MGSEWRIRLVPSAEREFAALAQRFKREVKDLIDGLGEDPFQENSQPLRASDKGYRIYAAGKRFRVLYRVNDHKGEVLILRIRDRGSAYRGLRNG